MRDWFTWVSDPVHCLQLYVICCHLLFCSPCYIGDSRCCWWQSCFHPLLCCHSYTDDSHVVNCHLLFCCHCYIDDSRAVICTGNDGVDRFSGSMSTRTQCCQATTGLRLTTSTTRSWTAIRSMTCKFKSMETRRRTCSSFGVLISMTPAPTRVRSSSRRLTFTHLKMASLLSSVRSFSCFTLLSCCNVLSLTARCRAFNA